MRLNTGVYDRRSDHDIGILMAYYTILDREAIVILDIDGTAVDHDNACALRLTLEQRFQPCNELIHLVPLL